MLPGLFWEEAFEGEIHDGAETTLLACGAERWVNRTPSSCELVSEEGTDTMDSLYLLTWPPAVESTASMMSLMRSVAEAGGPGCRAGNSAPACFLVDDVNLFGSEMADLNGVDAVEVCWKPSRTLPKGTGWLSESGVR